MLERAVGISSAATVADLSEGLRGLIEFAHGDMETACRQLIQDMERVADPGQAFMLGSMAVRAAWAAGHGALQREALQRLERRLPQGDFPNADLLPLLRVWWTEDVGDGADDRERDDQVVAPSAEILTRLGGSSWLVLPSAPLAMAWGIESVLGEALRRQIDALRQTDQVTALTQTLAQTTALDLAQGSWTSAEANALDGLQVAEETGDDHVLAQCLNGLGWLAAARGDEQTVADHAGRTFEVAVPRGVRIISAAAQWTVGMSALFAAGPRRRWITSSA